MTRTLGPDLNSRQLDRNNPEFRHLFRNPLAARSGGLSPLLPIRYLKSFQFSELRDRRMAQGGEAPVLVGAADSHSTASQVSRFHGNKYPDKCHFSVRVSDTQELYETYVPPTAKDSQQSTTSTATVVDPHVSFAGPDGEVPPCPVRQGGPMAPADIHSFPVPATSSAPEVSVPAANTREAETSGEPCYKRFLSAPCPGPAGSWPCALEFGHGGDHERFLPEPEESFMASYVVPNLKEVQRRVDRLIAERNDLLAVCIEMADRLEDIGHYGAGCYVRARAVIAAAEGK